MDLEISRPSDATAVPKTLSLYVRAVYSLNTLNVLTNQGFIRDPLVKNMLEFHDPVKPEA